ncbi:TauD/TfdA family dioxygenase [Streptomyces sp. NPDC059568]|uniref:TauD/TfdA family dioxygenase n=1 Tax=Streptomyces sp. NPDC059568 TaxID=3346868 RepID=UPI0036B95251
MRPAEIQWTDLFEEHYVDLVGAAPETTVAARLRDRGLVTFDGMNGRHAVVAIVSRIMTITPHRDSDPDGLTTIRDTGRRGNLEGFAGLGRGELAPHTEGSGVPEPPRLVLLVCEQPADRGGMSLLADGRAVHADLFIRNRPAALMLSRPRTVLFGQGSGFPSQVFSLHSDARISVRLRQDALARWNPFVAPYLPRLVEAITRNQHGIVLGAGQGYLADNHRWLHARTGFSGDRRYLRALGEPRFELARGFAPDPYAAISPDAVRDSLGPIGFGGEDDSGGGTDGDDGEGGNPSGGCGDGDGCGRS